MLIGAIMVVVGLAAVIMAVTGTQGQVFDVLTGHQPPTPKSSAQSLGSGDLSGLGALGGLLQGLLPGSGGLPALPLPSSGTVAPPQGALA